MLTAYTSQKVPEFLQPAIYRGSDRGGEAHLRQHLHPPAAEVQLPAVGTSQDQTSYTTNIAAKYRVTDYFTGLQVNWTIFDGLAIRGAKATSLARRRQLEQSYKDLAADLADTARSQLKQLDFARRDMEMTNRLLTSSAGALRDKKADAAARAGFGGRRQHRRR